jgi:dihydropteroate synthase
VKIATARGPLEFDGCLVAGIVNRTPDSFYDGGRMGLQESVDHALKLVEDGAGLLDIGAVRAGPGDPVSEEEEMDRLIPLLEVLASQTQIPISAETSRPKVAERAIRSGAALINDVSGLADPSLAGVCAETKAGLILMHHGGQLRGRPRHPTYEDVVADVKRDLQVLAEKAMAAGVDAEAIVVDPGLDFGKNTFHSLELVRRLEELTSGTAPVLVAPSRKDVVGETLGLPPDQRLEGTLALVALCALKGAAMVRVHDVAEATRVVRVVEAVDGVLPPAAPIRGLWD